MNPRLIHCNRRQALAGLAAASAVILPLPTRAQPQTWPTRPVRMVVNFPAGGPLDILARQVAGFLTNRLGQPFAVENVTGAAGEIGAANAARAQPDGYTLLMSIDAPFTIARAMRPQVGVRFEDLTWVAMLGTSGLTVAAHPQPASARWLNSSHAAAAGHSIFRRRAQAVLVTWPQRCWPTPRECKPRRCTIAAMPPL